MNQIKCINCGSQEKQVKAGKTASGSQKYKCKLCGKVYTPNKKERMYSEEIKQQAIKLYLEGTSSRTIGKILGISKNACFYWIKNIPKK